MDRAVRLDPERPLDVYELAMLLWRGRLKVAAFALAFALAGAAVALLMRPVYRAEATVQIREDAAGASTMRAMASQLGPLSALAAGVFGQRGDERAVALATLESRAIVEAYIRRENLVPLLFPHRWWRFGDPPSVQDAYRKFRRKVFSVAEDRKSGLVTVAVEWRDPQLAARWVEDLLADANAALKSRAIAESEANLEYLQAQAKKTTIVQVQTALYTLMESEYKKLMIARNSEDFVFRIIDPPEVPLRKVRPRRTLIVLGALALGAFTGVGFVVLQNLVRARRARMDEA